MTITSARKATDDKYSWEDEFAKDKRFIHSQLVKAFNKAGSPTRFPIPLITLPTIKEVKKQLNTYPLEAINCVQYCKYANIGKPNQCDYFRLRRGKHGYIACQNFQGDILNFQICKKCNAVRVVEYPTRLWGVCHQCRGQSEGDQHAKAIFPVSKETYEQYLAIKKKRLEELENE